MIHFSGLPSCPDRKSSPAPLPCKMRISCVIPTMNRGEVLCSTVEMLLSQSAPPYEVIIVDQTPEHNESVRSRLKAWQEKGEIKWLAQSEANASKARNTGALTASGDVVLFLDDDITIKPDF